MGYETADDAGVFRLDDERALVQTLDFFTPVVDDPYIFGAVAAANSLSDIYAMGGTPITAMAITCFPEKGVDLQILAQIMTGGVEKLHEAGVALLGGHTVTDPEIKFGYSVTGLIDPKRILTNSAALPGDALVLTKPLGIGIVTSGIKFNKVSQATTQEAIKIMTTLNRTAAEIMLRYDCHAATDITGNGLLGHAFEMARGSRVTLRFDSARIPFLEEAYPLAEAGLLPRTVATTWKMIQPFTRINPTVADPLRHILLDPQTSGGLLISLSLKDLDQIIDELKGSGVQAVHVGRVEAFQEAEIIVD